MSEDSDAPDLAAALDGLLAAQQYARARGLSHLSLEAADLYQRLGSAAPSEDWHGREVDL